MDSIQILLIAVGLSMDAFAAAVCKGMQAGRIIKRDLLLLALFFGAFQGLMPVLGWILGMQFERYITSIDHWIAFLLLSLIGGKMIYEALGNETCPAYQESSLKEITLLAIATSIDALAVGVSFAFIQVPILPASLSIAVITSLMSALGVLLGVKFGEKFKRSAELSGGIILCLIGLKILLEHLGVFGA